MNNGNTEKSTDISITPQNEPTPEDVTKEFPVAKGKTRTRNYQDVRAFKKRVEKRRKKKGYQ